MSEKILVTGGAGFIGSNFVPYFLETHPDLTIVNLDKMTYAADERNLTEVQGKPNYILSGAILRTKIWLKKSLRNMISAA